MTQPTIQENVFNDIRARREAADRKWGGGSMRYNGLTDEYRLTILAEEFGEVTRAILDKKPEDIRNELLDVAQVAVAWLEVLPEPLA